MPLCYCLLLRCCDCSDSIGVCQSIDQDTLDIWYNNRRVNYTQSPPKQIMSCDGNKQQQQQLPAIKRQITIPDIDHNNNDIESTVRYSISDNDSMNNECDNHLHRQNSIHNIEPDSPSYDNNVF